MEPEKTPRERADDLISLLVLDSRPTPQQVLWGIRIVLAFVIVLGVLTIAGRPFGITLWQWLDLLIIPAVLAIGGFLFTQSENRASRFVAEQRTQDEVLQAYLEQIGNLLLDKDRPLRQSKEDDEVRTLARAQTLTVLSRLDGERKGRVLQLLYDSDLISRERPVLALSKADLSEAVLPEAYLVRANLTEADLSGANLSEANLRYAVLNGANLSYASLADAKVPPVLAVAESLEGATMPNGQKYEEWLKDRQKRQ